MSPKVIRILFLPTFLLDCVVCTCPINYIQSDAFCYKFPSVQLDWANATLFCPQDGGSMAVISSAQENTAYANYRNSLPITGDPVWLGVHYITTSGGTWQFLTDYTGGSTVYHNFLNGTIPIGHDGDCIIGWFQNSDFVWSPVHCNTSLYFICEARPTNVVTTTSAPVIDIGDTNSTGISTSSNWIKVLNNFRFPVVASPVPTLGRSVVFCAVGCAQSSQCVAFNHKPHDNECQLIHNEVNASAAIAWTGWDLWIDGNLLYTFYNSSA
ncbi:rheacalcin-1 [Biomphalaria pfeifferi]|uniref:Rheacalcin-1 n=1 Tax=Biomphalaria pfeifferi TaxID=112525 RepID=A0AAD8C8Z3_BIOPF|nr:rheacalcin-1 [Biomphalaria pfeifferi]